MQRKVRIASSIFPYHCQHWWRSFWASKRVGFPFCSYSKSKKFFLDLWCSPHLHFVWAPHLEWVKRWGIPTLRCLHHPLPLHRCNRSTLYYICSYFALMSIRVTLPTMIFCFTFHQLYRKKSSVQWHICLWKSFLCVLLGYSYHTTITHSTERPLTFSLLLGVYFLWYERFHVGYWWSLVSALLSMNCDANVWFCWVNKKHLKCA